MELLRPSRSAKGSLRPCAFAAQCPLAMFYSGSVPTQRNFENLMEPQVFAALVACFMGATDGLSLGAVLWCGSPTLGKDQRLSDIGVFYGSYRLYYLYDFNVTLRRFCFEVACFSHPLLLCRTLVLKKKKPPSFPRLKNGEVKQITEEPRLSSFGYVHWFAHNPSALEALEGEFPEWYDKVKSLEVKPVKRLSHQVANAGSLMGSEIKFGVAGASNSKKKKQTSKHKK